MRETQTTIEAWRRDTFGEGPTDIKRALFRMAVRANTEMAELLVKVATNAPHEERHREAADVAIVLYGVAELGGFDLRASHGFYEIEQEVSHERCWLQASQALARCVYEIGTGLCKCSPIMPRYCFRWLERGVWLSGYGETLDNQVDAKMAINRARVWAKTDEGHGHHVDPVGG